MRRKRAAWKSWILAVMMLVWACSASVLAEEASGDNSLSSLGIVTEGVTVSPEFYYSTIEYQVTVPSGTSYLELNPVTSNPGASIDSIEGQTIGEDGKTTVVITVSAANGNQCGYYLYVTTDENAQAPAAEAETEAQTEPVTEKQTETEPETEDPRYVKVDRNSLEEAENTISTLKTETGNYRDRVNLLTKILYGMIGLCVILLFVVINLILKKRDLKAELQEYRGYGYPGDGNGGAGAQTYADGEGAYGAYSDGQGYDGADPYDGGQGYDGGGQYDGGQGYDGGAYDDGQGYDRAGQSKDGQAHPEDSFAEPAPESSRREKKKAKKGKDDPSTVPKPSKARKQKKQMPEYQSPEPEHEYQPPKEKTPDHVEVNMIDL